MLCASATQTSARPTSKPTAESADVAEIVRRTLELPDRHLDYAHAKVAFDQLVEPSFDAQSVFAELDRLTDAARGLAGPDAIDGAKLTAVRTVIYESGPWNDESPFAYDLDDPLGRHIPNKLLSNYLATRRGQCVSMPILFLIIADRLGLNVALASAPEHVFVRYIDARGRTFNLETTSGAHLARDLWVRQNFPMTDRAIQNGLYLRCLSKREGVVVIASTVVEHLWHQQRFDEVIVLAKLLLQHHPRDVGSMLWLGSAYGKRGDQLRDQYSHAFLAPPLIRAELWSCFERNRTLFATAERLGWQPIN